jgi:alkanesulfonate monooxygenase SsuD/methylene tetrahydromethanopterin reductase-like flavin-dependent oxidoreductase (luciferase family)
MRIGLALPSFVDDPEIPIRVARAAESAGLDGVFVYDHIWRDIPPPRRPALECFTLLGAVAAETSRIHVGTLVARATLRPPASLAVAFETAQRISGGRLIAAIGAGDAQSRPENEAFGLPFGTTASRIAALRDAARAAHGRGFPVWVGGKATVVREIVALADGWNWWGGTAEQFGEQSALVRAVAPTATLTWGGLLLLGRNDDHATEKARDRRVGEDVVFGGPESVADRLRAYSRAGAEWTILGPLDATDPENAIVLGESVAPLLRPR